MIAQVPVFRVTVRLGPVNIAGTSIDALKKGSEQYLRDGSDLSALAAAMHPHHGMDTLKA